MLIIIIRKRRRTLIICSSYLQSRQFTYTSWKRLIIIIIAVCCEIGVHLSFCVTLYLTPVIASRSLLLHKCLLLQATFLCSASRVLSACQASIPLHASAFIYSQSFLLCLFINVSLNNMLTEKTTKCFMMQTKNFHYTIH